MSKSLRLFVSLLQAALKINESGGKGWGERNGKPVFTTNAIKKKNKTKCAVLFFSLLFLDQYAHTDYVDNVVSSYVQ